MISLTRAALLLVLAALLAAPAALDAQRWRGGGSGSVWGRPALSGGARGHLGFTLQGGSRLLPGVRIVQARRPTPLVNRPMGYPASAQPIGSPRRFAPKHRHPVFGLPFLFPAPVLPFGGVSVVSVSHATVIAPVAGDLTYEEPVATGCAVVTVHLGGDPWTNRVRLPQLGAESPAELFRVLSGRLAEGRQANLDRLEGGGIVIPAGPGVTGLMVEECSR